MGKIKIKNHNGKEFFLFEKKTFFALVIASVLTLLVYFFGSDARQFLTSTLQQIPEHAPYDGVTMPMKEAPNWSKLTDAERKMPYSELPREKFMPIPEYAPERLEIPFESLEWGNVAHQKIRNEKITYPVPYLGTYELDGREGAGSHPAVDIKVPSGTPVYAIGNGTVVKTSISSGGFGNHIAIQHNNFPSPDDPSKRETIFSSYSHLNEIIVAEMQVVVKGQLIGYSGSTGLSSTPHLHFQIDRESAPWHPYWPFTSSDTAAAGLTFFQALNSGFHKEEARANTINPVKYIQQWNGVTQLISTADTTITSTTGTDSSAESQYKFVAQAIGGPFVEGAEIVFSIRITDTSGNVVKRQSFDDRVKIELRDGRGTLSKGFLSSGFFMTGETKAITLQNPAPGKEKLIIRFRNEEFTSEEFEIMPKTSGENTAMESTVTVTPPASNTDAVLGSSSDSSASAILPLGKTYKMEDIASMPFPRLEITLDRKLVHVGEAVHGMLQYFNEKAENVAPESDQVIFIFPLKGQAEVSPPTARKESFADGKLEFSFTPQAPEMMVIEAAGGGLMGFSDGLDVIALTAQAATSDVSTSTDGTPTDTISIDPAATEPVFTDIPIDSPLDTPLRLLKSKGVIKGYADGTFQPEKLVFRVEALKMIFEALSETVSELGTLLFPDLQAESWYLPFVEHAFKNGIVKGYSDGTFRPTANVNIVEFYKMLFLAAKTDINPDITVTLPEGVKPEDWFAPYIQEALRRNILEANGPLQPGKAMTRGEIAEALYRLLK